MRVQVTEVVDPAQGTVAFSCAVGEAVGRWRGEDAARIGSYDVELEIPEAVDRWAPHAPGPGSLSGVGPQDLAVTGVVVAVGEDDDPVLSLRVGTDILLVELAAPVSWPAIGETIALRARTLELYPYQL
ncbi:hypothetical protein AB0K51_23000 [Kitasatospora sp. NPDC049285]|uniref:hypothetical protein n=1 Tax=Kitasatospora sp. NPDC049285 TaxID=3157096 RepID=UPI003419540A